MTSGTTAPTGISRGPLELQQLRRLQEFLGGPRNYRAYGVYGAYRNFWGDP